MSDQNSNQTPETPSADAVVVKQNVWTKFSTKHPRAAKVVVITGASIAALSIAAVANTVQKNRSHVVAAGNEAKEALNELGQAVSPTSETTSA